MLETIILGIVQGLTEFLPVSSSGHLEIAKAILGDDRLPKDSMLLTVVLHIATAISTMVVFRQEIIRILKGLFSFRWNDETQFALKIIVSMIPAAIVGVFFMDQLELLFNKQLMFVGFMLLVTAVLLLLADRAKSTDKKVGWLEAVIVGIAQMIAILPGVSRSGATISTSVLLGIDRDQAARFSFLMVVPLILGYMAKKIIDGKPEELVVSSSGSLELMAGFVAAFLTGIFACTWMISLVRKAKLSYFAYYCLVVGVATIIWAWRFPMTPAV